MNKKLKALSVKAAQILEDKKGESVVLYDLGGKSSLCDYVIVATATSAPHLNALEEEVSIKLKEDGFYKLNRDGSGSQVWRVSDYGGLILHLMTKDARAYYALDKMFDYAVVLPLKEPVKKIKKAVKTIKKTTKKIAKKITKKPANKTVKKATKKVSKTVKKTVKKAVKKTKKTTKKGAK